MYTLYTINSGEPYFLEIYFDLLLFFWGHGNLDYGNLSAFYYAINLARQLSKYLYSLQKWDAPDGKLATSKFSQASPEIDLTPFLAEEDRIAGSNSVK